MKDPQKRILYVVHRFWPHPGGSERLFYNFARQSVSEGHHVTVFTTNALDPESYHKPWKKRLTGGSERKNGIDIYRFQVVNIPFQYKVLGALSLLPIDSIRLLLGYPFVLLPGYLREIFIARPHFDLIIAGVLPHSHLIYPAAWLARHSGAPWITVPLVHTGLPGDKPLRGYLTREQLKLLKRADAIITVTEAGNRALIARGIASTKLHTVGVGVDPMELVGGQGKRFRDRFHLEGPMVLHMSTLTCFKGTVDLVESMKRLWANGHPAHLVLIGQLTDEFESYFLTQPPFVYERTLLLGFVDDETKKDALDACDIFALPSSADSFGVVFLEAWLYGKPVIGAEAGGIPYVISDDRDGLLVKFGDVAGLARRIDDLLSDPDRRHSLGEAGRQKVLTHYTWDKVCERMSEVTNSLLYH